MSPDPTCNPMHVTNTSIVLFDLSFSCILSDGLCGPWCCRKASAIRSNSLLCSLLWQVQKTIWSPYPLLESPVCFCPQNSLYDHVTVPLLFNLLTGKDFPRNSPEITDSYYQPSVNWLKHSCQCYLLRWEGAKYTPIDLTSATRNLERTIHSFSHSFIYAFR